MGGKTGKRVKSGPDADNAELFVDCAVSSYLPVASTWNAEICLHKWT